MEANSHLIFGPAYIDYVIETTSPLVPGGELVLDQSLSALHAHHEEHGQVVVKGDNGDLLTFTMPPECTDFAATYRLAEPVLARLLGAETTQTLVGTYPVQDFRQQIGGMGSGYAKALHGLLRMPLGRDSIADEVLRQLHRYGIAAMPSYLEDCTSDTSLLLVSSHGDKLAIGVRQAMIRWQLNEEDRLLLSQASALVFCGAPNSLMAEVLAQKPDIPVMCAPAMRNVCDTATPLAELASKIDYLTLNALEWEHLPDADTCRANIPLVSVTDGPHGSHLYLREENEVTLPAETCYGPINTNRAGETYGSTIFKVLLHEAPDFFKTRQVQATLARWAGTQATTQATRQLHIAGFAFPPDDWKD